MDDGIYCFGLVVSPTPLFNGEEYAGALYAELVPAYVPWYRRLLPHVGRYWYEVHGTDGYHYHEYDGGAYTFSGALRKANDAVQACVDNMQAEIAAENNRRA